MNPVISAIERRIAEDSGGRGIENLVQWGHLEASALALRNAPKVGIISGFYVPDAMMGETDGPPGAKAIGEALTGLGSEVIYITDHLIAPLFEALALPTIRLYDSELLQREALTHVVSIERVGRARDGNYYNMRGKDISAYTEPIDEMVLQANAAGLPTIGIGDGGNEIGMGLVREQAVKDVPNGELIACDVSTTHLIVCGVANWGGYGLAAALSLLSGRELLPSTQQAKNDVLRLAEAGAVDGVTRKAESTVDGLPLSESMKVLENIRALMG